MRREESENEALDMDSVTVIRNVNKNFDDKKKKAAFSGLWMFFRIL
jgi:hypothetical protein